MTPLRIAVTAVLAVALVAGRADAQVRLPDFGDPSDTVFSGSLEKQVGEAFMRQIRATATLVDDPEVADYIGGLGYRLVSASALQNLAFHFFAIEDGVVNAFAAPGGYVGVNTGLILAAGSESELAAVLAHEISHVTQRHLARQIELGERSNIAALAGLLAAIAIGIVNPEAGKAAAVGVLGSQAQQQLNNSRANEQEADRVGMQMLDAAGFDPEAMARFFEKLQTEGRFYRQPPEFLSTHPVTTARIADAQARARQLGVRQHRDSLAFRMVQAKLHLQRDPDNERLLAFFRERISRSGPTRSPGLRYGLALTLARAGRFDEAMRELDSLVQQAPRRVELRIARAEVAARAGDWASAEAIYSDAHALMPDSRLVNSSYAQALLARDQAKAALKVLDTHARLAALSAPMHRQRAEALARLGRRSDAQIALAEHYALRGDLINAIGQLKQASQDPDNDYYKASRIEARIEALELERAERILER
jgi:predicted Zn-dependent protease